MLEILLVLSTAAFIVNCMFAGACMGAGSKAAVTYGLLALGYGLLADYIRTRIAKMKALETPPDEKP